MNILQTARLYLREMLVSDAQSAYELNLDPDVIRYTGDIPFHDVEDAREFLYNYNSYKKYGFGRWAVVRKSDGIFLGWCGLKYTPEIDEYDIGFRFHKKYWGLGYATESASACIEWGFDNIDTDVIVGRAMTDNIGSYRVLEKIGLQHSETRDEGNSQLLIYKIRRGRK